MNVAGIFAGTSETNLTEKGKKQAKAAGKKLQNHIDRIDLIISSPLSRTLHTARIVADGIGYPKDKIQKHDLLIERNYGILDGKHHYLFFQDGKTHKDLDKVEGIETILDLQNRAEEALKYLESLPHDNILVVSHGTFGRALIRAVKRLPHTHEYESEFRIGNAEILELV
jgi:uncharacterized phosphatase